MNHARADFRRFSNVSSKPTKKRRTTDAKARLQKPRTNRSKQQKARAQNLLVSKLHLISESEWSSLRDSEVLQRSDVAIDIERMCHILYRRGSKQYSRKMFDIIHGFKKKENLKEDVLRGRVSTRTLVRMTTDELAPNHIRKQRAKIAEKNMKKRIITKPYKPFTGKRDHWLATDWIVQNTY